jgi:hypothetical protein
MANAGGSKNATLTKPGAAYAPKGGNDLESLMAKFNNSLAIQNLMNNTQSNNNNNASYHNHHHGVAAAGTTGTSNNKSRNHQGNVPQFKTTAAAVGLSLGSTKGIGKTMLMGNATTTNNAALGNIFFDGQGNGGVPP